MIKVSNLYKNFGKLEVLKGIDTVIEKGEVVVVIGPSGSGKSTFLRCLNYLEEPTKGEIIVDGVKLNHSQTNINRVRQEMGMVFQQFNLFPHMTVTRNVALAPIKVKKMGEREAVELAHQILARVGLSDKINAYPGELSGGQQQRVGIARALALNPEIMLLDEPTASLDPILVGEVLDVMEDLARNTKATMIIVTHEVSFALKVAHRIILMDHGKIVEEGTPAEIFSQPQSEIGRKYKRLLMS